MFFYSCLQSYSVQNEEAENQNLASAFLWVAKQESEWNKLH